MPCPLMSSIVPIPGLGMSRCSINASRISLNYPCSSGSGYLNDRPHSSVAKALPSPGHLRSEFFGGGHVSLWVLGPNQPAPLIPKLSQSIASPRALEPPTASKWKVGFPVSSSLYRFVPLVLVEHQTGQPVF